jgi:phosphocarrier protein
MSQTSENENQPELLTFTLEVSNKMGVHARPAAMIVRITSRYEGEIWVTKEDEKINAKSIMGIMMLAAAKGTPLKFEAQCVNAAEFEKEMRELFASKFQDE